MQLPELTFHWRPITMSPLITRATADLQATWTRPDGEELIQAIDIWRTATELACGFYYRWDFGNAEADKVWTWKYARSEWGKWLRRYLSYQSKPGLDSPALVESAMLNGLYPNEKGVKAFRFWKGVEHTVTPIQVIEWIDADWLTDALDWEDGCAFPSIIWFTHTAVGLALQTAGIPAFFSGENLLDRIPRGRSIALSVKACGTGIDGLQRLYRRQLIQCPVASGAQTEQLLGRLHRPGQGFSVETHYYIRDREAVEQAKREAEYIQQSMGVEQKLLTGRWRNG